MQCCDLLTGVGTTIRKVNHHIKQVRVMPNIEYFSGLTFLTIVLYYYFLGNKLTANTADLSSFIRLTCHRLNELCTQCIQT